MDSEWGTDPYGLFDYNYFPKNIITTSANIQQINNTNHVSFLLAQDSYNATGSPSDIGGPSGPNAGGTSAASGGTTIPGHYECSCAFVPCNGSPCEQITDYFSALWNNYRQFKLDFIDFYTKNLADPRSDIMKELTYSRQSANTCSAVDTMSNSQEELLDCTRVKDEIMSPFNTGEVTYNNQTADVGCYGQDLGLAVGKDLTDNWFCCQVSNQNTVTPNQ